MAARLPSGLYVVFAVGPLRLAARETLTGRRDGCERCVQAASPGATIGPAGKWDVVKEGTLADGAIPGCAGVL